MYRQPGPGGYGVILDYQGRRRERSAVYRDALANAAASGGDLLHDEGYESEDKKQLPFV
jgi:hypothetical protein